LKELRSTLAGLKQLKAMKSLELGFIVCLGLNKEFFQTLSTGLKNLPSLVSLTINFSSTNINDQELESFCLGLKSQTSLQTLSLILSRCTEITDHGVHHLSLSINSLCFLKHFILSLTGSEKIGDLGLASLSSTLKNSLTTFILDCSDYRMITNQGIEDLMINAHSIKSLKFDFSGCTNIADEGLRYLQNHLEKIEELSTLRLDFSYCNKISTKAVIRFICAFERKISLQTPDLHLFYCQNINKNCVQDLVKNINSKTLILYNGGNHSSF